MRRCCVSGDRCRSRVSDEWWATRARPTSAMPDLWRKGQPGSRVGWKIHARTRLEVQCRRLIPLPATKNGANSQELAGSPLPHSPSARLSGCSSRRDTHPRRSSPGLPASRGRGVRSHRMTITRYYPEGDGTSPSGVVRPHIWRWTQ